MRSSLGPSSASLGLSLGDALWESSSCSPGSFGSSISSSSSLSSRSPEDEVLVTPSSSRSPPLFDDEEETEDWLLASREEVRREGFDKADRVKPMVRTQSIPLALASTDPLSNVKEFEVDVWPCRSAWAAWHHG